LVLIRFVVVVMRAVDAADDPELSTTGSQRRSSLLHGGQRASVISASVAPGNARTARMVT
jgi:hypothetical protein